MSPFVIAGIVVIGLFVLLAIGIAQQAIEKNAKEKRRLHSALHARSRSFLHMLDGSPEGFLGTDLQILVCQCLLETYEQLRKINPADKTTAAEAEQIKQRLQQYRSRPSAPGAVRLTDQAQALEVQAMLKKLYSFIATLAASKRINATEAQAYALQIQRLNVQATTDSMDQEIRDSLAAGKYRLAMHTIQIAMNNLTNANTDGFYNDRIANYKTTLQELQEAANADTGPSAEEMKKSEQDWDSITKVDETWKKKAQYD